MDKNNSYIHERGFSLLEIIISMVIFGIMSLTMITLQEQQARSNNYLEFQLKRTQLQNTLITQFLNDPMNCACLFDGAAPLPLNPTNATLTGVAPTIIGKYNFLIPGCATATIPQPLIDTSGLDGLRMNDVKITNINNISGVFSGSFEVSVSSLKKVMGSNNYLIRIPVHINKTTSGTNAIFNSCSVNSGPTSAFSNGYTNYSSPARQWNTNYPNNLGRPIQVIVTLAGVYGSAYVNGLLIATASAFNSGSGFTDQLSFIVPPGATYRVDGGGPVTNWVELN